jgi:hypothetical protein
MSMQICTNIFNEATDATTDGGKYTKMLTIRRRISQFLWEWGSGQIMPKMTKNGNYADVAERDVIMAMFRNSTN